MKTTLFLTLVLCLAAISPSRAADEKSSLLLPPSSSKSVYLLYKKMSGMSFNAAETLQSTDAYRQASPADQTRMLAAEKTPLEAEYAALDPQRQVIIVRTAVGAAAQLSPRPSLKITFDATDRPASAIYFPYTWARMNIAVVPDKLEPFLDIPLKATEATAAIAKISGGSATMVIEMLPVKTDPSPMRLDGLDQWLLSSKIVAVAYYNQNMQSIWQWQAPDYRRAGAPSPLIDLKR